MVTIFKAALSIIEEGLKQVPDSHQLCASQTAGVDGVVYDKRSLLLWEDTEVVLLVDASNTCSYIQLP